VLVARHVRRRLLMLSVSILGFFISSFSAVLASDFTAPVVSILVVSVLDGDTIEVLHNHRERIRLSGTLTALRGASLRHVAFVCGIKKGPPDKYLS